MVGRPADGFRAAPAIPPNAEDQWPVHHACVANRPELRRLSARLRSEEWGAKSQDRQDDGNRQHGQPDGIPEPNHAFARPDPVVVHHCWHVMVRHR